MATELENSIRNAAEKITRYVADAAEMKVETSYVQVGANGETDFTQARPAARTIVKLDGDSQAIVPVRPAQSGGFEVDASLFDIHERNVATTIEYRARILNALLSLLQTRNR